jgi:16S rRNA (cytidine1402-2'-O)-methyltransferase
MLYLVATPLGNADDLSKRALHVLREVDVVCAEDTRHSRRLLELHGIHRSMWSYHDHSDAEQRERILVELRSGRSVALISDAGTPCIADPGYRLVEACWAEGIRVTCVPGPSAVITFLAASGLPTDRFQFAGFLPRKEAARRATLEELLDSPATLVVYEAPHRVLAMLEDLREVAPDRRIVLGRELTKKFEEFVRGSAEELLAHFARTTTEPRGEYVVGVQGREEMQGASDAELDAWVDDLLAAGLRGRDIAALLSRRLGRSRDEVYAATLRRKGVR